MDTRPGHLACLEIHPFLIHISDVLDRLPGQLGIDLFVMLYHQCADILIPLAGASGRHQIHFNLRTCSPAAAVQGIVGDSRSTQQVPDQPALGLGIVITFFQVVVDGTGQEGDALSRFLRPLHGLAAFVELGEDRILVFYGVELAATSHISTQIQSVKAAEDLFCIGMGHAYSTCQSVRHLRILFGHARCLRRLVTEPFALAGDRVLGSFIISDAVLDVFADQCSLHIKSIFTVLFLVY